MGGGIENGYFKMVNCKMDFSKFTTLKYPFLVLAVNCDELMLPSLTYFSFFSFLGW